MLAATSSQTWRSLLALFATMSAIAFSSFPKSPPCTPVVEHWYEARLGMSKDEITALFGTPSTIRGPARIEAGSGDSNKDSDLSLSELAAFAIGSAIMGGTDEQWDYGPPHFLGWVPSPELLDLLSLRPEAPREEHAKKLALVSEQELDWALGGFPFGHPEAFVVAFDSDGKVSRLWPPSRGRYSNFRRLDRIESSAIEVGSQLP